MTGFIDLEHVKPTSIIERAVKTGQSQLLDDASRDKDYLLYDSRTRSALAVPIKIGDEVIGVINIEHPNSKVFHEDDQRALEALAAQAAIAIQNARQYEDLMKTKGLVGARTALAWMGITSGSFDQGIAINGVG